MFTNYLKITLAVMRRRKFFTFISLFGISITLMVLIIFTAFYEHLFGAQYPEIHRDRSLYCSRITQEDTIQQSTNSGPLGVYFIENYMRKMKTPEQIGFSSMPNTMNTYGNGKKVKLMYKYTDPVFWSITNFQFLEGKPFTQKELDNNEAVAVINDITRDNYFGKNTHAVGKTIEFDGQNLRVIGVILGCPVTRVIVAADIYIPYTLEKQDARSTSLSGPYLPIVLARSAADLPLIQAEYQEMIPRIPLEERDGFKPQKIETKLSNFLESILGGTFLSPDDGSAQSRFYLFITIFALLFMSLPAINLVNINVSRIMERSSEIGIRKSFGASSKTLVYQFVIENILLTLIGGALALALSGIFIYWFNHSGMLEYADLSINWKVISIAILLSLVFGLMSGVLPAWRMSKLPIVEALKQ